MFCINLEVNEFHTAPLIAVSLVQAFYVINCRYVTASCMTLEAWYGNPWATGMALFNLALQVRDYGGPSWGSVDIELTKRSSVVE